MKIEGMRLTKVNLIEIVTVQLVHVNRTKNWTKFGLPRNPTFSDSIN